jgi:hypothetical protein
VSSAASRAPDTSYGLGNPYRKRSGGAKCQVTCGLLDGAVPVARERVAHLIKADDAGLTSQLGADLREASLSVAGPSAISQDSHPLPTHRHSDPAGDANSFAVFRPISRFGVHAAPGRVPAMISTIHVADLCQPLLLAADRGGRLERDEAAMSGQGIYFGAYPQTFRYDHAAAFLSPPS